MKTLVDLIANSPLLNVVSINVMRNEIILDLGRRTILATRQAGFLPNVPELRSALKQAQQAVTLMPDGDDRRVDFHTCDGDMAYISETGGARFRFHLDRQDNGKPPHWFGNEYRTDSLGREWGRSYGHMVMDDFGQLVNMEGCAA